MEGYIDLKRLNIDELIGVVNLYPWFAGARKELCLRMGGETWSSSQFADSAMHMPSKRVLSDIIRKGQTKQWEDEDVEKIIKSYIAERQEKREAEGNTHRRVYAGAGDYFSQEDYDNVRQDDDSVFSRRAFTRSVDKLYESETEQMSDIVTETLAQIYAEQGYYEHAKEIYSKLILAYPEKNAYFAALIDKMDELN